MKRFSATGQGMAPQGAEGDGGCSGPMTEEPFEGRHDIVPGDLTSELLADDGVIDQWEELIRPLAPRPAVENGRDAVISCDTSGGKSRFKMKTIEMKDTSAAYEPLRNLGKRQGACGSAVPEDVSPPRPFFDDNKGRAGIG